MFKTGKISIKKYHLEVGLGLQESTVYSSLMMHYSVVNQVGNNSVSEESFMAVTTIQQEPLVAPGLEPCTDTKESPIDTTRAYKMEKN